MPAQDISLFPRYSQAENRTTNYTLLVLRLLYEESPALYQETLERLLPDAGVATMPAFRQQESVGGSVLDGVISQASYVVFVETKRGDDFREEQMRSHLEALASRVADVRVLIALSPFADGDQEHRAAEFQAWADDIAGRAGAARSGAGGRVTAVAVSFADFLEALPTPSAETVLARVIQEYEGYLQTTGLLETWRTRMDVVPVGKWPHHVSELGVYTCPATGGAYHHQRCAFLGAYRDKRITHVAAIRALVRVPLEGKPTVMWQNDPSLGADELIATARERAIGAWGGLREDLQVFVLDAPHSTDFRRTTPSGLRARSYLNLKRLGTAVPTTGAALATALRGRTWSELL